MPSSAVTPAATQTIELISHDLCPFVQRAVIALLEKDVAFKRTRIDLDDRPQWFKDISPLGKVPLLRVGTAVLFESAVILEYLEDTQPPALHPGDPLVRARHRAWMEFGSNLLMDNYAFLLAPNEEAMLARRDAVRQKVERLEQAMGPGPYFGGAAFSLVDAVFAPFFRYWDAFERVAAFHVFDAAPQVQAWRHALAQRPSVRAAFGDGYEERLLAALRKRDSHLASLLAPALLD